MSHIFFSYAHSDKEYLDKLVSWLQDNGFNEHELWYDRHIEGGNNWRDEIATALDEAFAVVVIVTANSAKSLYCTFEWAYAMGQGIPILPLVFDDVSIADVPTPLTSKQFTDCTDTIPDFLNERLRRLKSTPPQVAAINKLVYEIIYDTHRQFFILGWIGDGLIAFDLGSKEDVIDHFTRKATEAYQSLQELMTEKAFAFSGKQHRHCWQLIDILRRLSRIQPEFEDYFPNDLFALFDNTWLPAYEYFEGKPKWRKWTRRFFEWDLEDEHNRMEVFAEMIRAFPILHTTNADILIQNKIIDQKRKKESD